MYGLEIHLSITESSLGYQTTAYWRGCRDCSWDMKGWGYDLIDSKWFEVQG